MIANIHGIEEPIFNWFAENTPALGLCLIIIMISSWATMKFSQYNNRLIRVEHDTGELKRDVKLVKRRLSRLDKKFDQKISDLDKKLDLQISQMDKKLDQKVSEVDRKLDKLINYFIVTKQVDKETVL